MESPGFDVVKRDPYQQPPYSLISLLLNLRSPFQVHFMSGFSSVLLTVSFFSFAFRVPLTDSRS